jgi:hypothetical protein
LSLEALPEPTISPVFWLDIWASLKPDLKWVVNFLKHLHKGEHLKRVVVTGLGIVSSIGNDTSAVLSSLKNHTSGIVFSEKLKEFNLRSQVIGDINIDISQYLTKKQLRFLSPRFKCPPFV